MPPGAREMSASVTLPVFWPSEKERRASGSSAVAVNGRVKSLGVLLRWTSVVSPRFFQSA